MKQPDHSELFSGISAEEVAHGRVARAIAYFEQQHLPEWNQFLDSSIEVKSTQIDAGPGAAAFLLVNVFCVQVDDISPAITWRLAKFWAVARSLGLQGREVERLGLYTCGRFGEFKDTAPSPKILLHTWHVAISALREKERACITQEAVLQAA